jgi:signal transduction histidine kinase
MLHRPLNKDLSVQKIWAILLACSALILSANADASPTSVATSSWSLNALQTAVLEHTSQAQSFTIHGIVCAVMPQAKLLALQDNTGAVLLELPALDAAIHVGDCVTVTATNCLLAHGRFRIRLTTTLVDNDDLHSAALKSGSIFLEAGRQPVHLEWFNWTAGSELSLEIAGPGLARQRVPEDLLKRTPNANSDPAESDNGLDFAAYNGDWNSLPDFTALSPVARGVATNFSLNYRARPEHTALVFDGFLQISNAGVYNFYLTSDDGSRLKIGRSMIACAITPGSTPIVPATKTFEQALSDRNRSAWVKLQGEATFAGENQDNLEMDVAGRGNNLPVTILGGSALIASNLLHQQIQVEGICEFSGEGEGRSARLIVPGVAQFKISPPIISQPFFTNELLTTAAQVRHLKPDEARAALPVIITGVVIATFRGSLVLQDASGGIYINMLASEPSFQPAIGQFLEIAGRTAPGDFSPIVYAEKVKIFGVAAMPEPIRPSWNQIISGSLDAEYVEISGVIIARSETEMRLLTQDGMVTIKSNDRCPLPQIFDAALAGGSLIGSAVRMRGCFSTEWSPRTRKMIVGSFYLYPAAVEVEEPAPRDPFSLPVSKAADLLGFNARASALQRIKVAGQVVLTWPGEFFLLDEQTGIRVLTASEQTLQDGDLVEAVGFPQLGGPAPILQEAQVRKTGHAPRPDPVVVSSADLLNHKHDSTLVQVQALVISDALQMDRRILELQAGPYRFLATLREAGENLKMIPPGSLVQLTGVYASATDDSARKNPGAFELLLGRAGDISILKKPSWWTLRRAIIVAAVLAGGLGITLIWIFLLRGTVAERTAQLRKEIEERHRVEQHRVMEQERARVAQDLHDELGVGLTQVGILGSLAKNPSLSTEVKNQYLDQLAEAARSLVTGLDEIVWAVNPKYDSAASLASYYALFAQRFLNLADIACRFDAVEELPDYPMVSQLRHGIFLVFKEALNNVVRHSRATEVRLRITVISEQLMISIIDNGCGFAAGAAKPGSDGISGMHQRMEKLGGRCVIISQVGKGTTVEFTLALGKNRS